MASNMHARKAIKGNHVILMIDNYDSFTYNLVQYLAELGAAVQVHRNDQISIQEINALAPSHLIISPGPGNPQQAGVCLEVITHFAGHIPILGVCLGHQSIAEAFGARIVHAPTIMHGKTSLIYHEDNGIFQELPRPFQATRYHSLVVDPASLPADFIVTAWTQTPEGEREAIMGIRHRSMPLEGVQFHPESILTTQGHQLLRNFLTRQSAHHEEKEAAACQTPTPLPHH